MKFLSGLPLTLLLLLFLSVDGFSQPVSCNNWLGLPSYQSYVSVGDLDIAGNQITVEAIINRTQPYSPGTGDNNEGDIVSKHQEPINVNYLLRPNHAYITTTNGFFGTPDICEIELQKTYHVAMVYDGSTLKFYRNGYLMSSVPATGNLFQNDFPTRIGLYSGGVLENFLGYVNEVRIWNIARTQNDIKAYMNSSLPNPATQVGLKAYYTFDNLQNKQGNATYNGTLTGSASINQTNPNCTFIADSCYRTVDCNRWLYMPTQGARFAVGDIDISGNQLTVEAVFNRTHPLNNGAFYGRLVSKHTNQMNVNYGLLPNGCEIRTSNGYKSTFQTCAVQLNKTYHVAMVYDGVALKYYQNGFLMSQVPCTGNLVTNDLITTIGQIATSAIPIDEQFLGYINEVRIWNVARTQTQIQTFMNSSLPNPASQTGLRAYYTFDNVTNDQGNAAYNGVAGGGAVINQTNPNCTFVADSCRTTPPDVIASFTAPATVCVNDPVSITNTSQNASSYYWSFCAADPTVSPVGTNLGNPGANLVSPVYAEMVKANNNYYLFVVNHWPGGLVRLDFGNSYLNTPTAVSLGNVGGIIPIAAEGIKIIYNNGHWLALIMIGGNAASGVSPRIVKIDFGADITNTSPVGTNWGNIGNLDLPHELHMFQENGVWYGLTVNAMSNTVTRFNFTSDLINNTPTGVNLGTFNGLNYPTGINAVNDNGNWHVFITSDNDNPNLVRLDFGSSLLNTPVATNLGNPGGALRKTRDIYILKECGQINAFVINGLGVNQLVKLDFGGSVTAVPTATNLGNTGGMNFPHSITGFFRIGNDLYTFVPNVTNNSITRIRFPGCSGSSIPNSSVQTPPVITYTTPGTYNITLTIDDGLPTQATVCQQVVVTDCTPPVTADFTAPTTVCVNEPVSITNTSQNATSYYWSFCAADPTMAPIGVNIGNPGSLLTKPVFMDYVLYNGNYYGFVINQSPARLIRLNFGTSLLNVPTATDLGNFGGILPATSSEGIQVVQNEGKWYAIIVGGSPTATPAAANTPRIVKVDFGADLTNTTPAAVNWGNIGNLLQPVEIHVFKEGGSWYGFATNAENNTITRFNFTSSFDNTPTAVNLGGFGLLDHPAGINAVNDNGNWYVFIVNDNDNSNLVRLDFGNSLLNTPTATNVGNPGGLLRKTRDIYFLKECDRITAFAVNGFSFNHLIRLGFGNNILSTPTAASFGNIGSMNFPHSISKIFRVGNDLYTFVTNVDNNTITRIGFFGCSSSSIPSSSQQNPAPITYTVPGTYNITLTVDDGLPTQTTVCQQVIVTDCPPVVINQYTEVLSFDACKNALTVADASAFNPGDTVLMIQMKGAVIDSTNTAAFGTVTDYKNAGNYEFNYIKSKTGNEIELLNAVKRQYTIPDGKVQLVRVPYFQDYTVTRKLTAAPWDGSKGGVLTFNVQNSLTLNADIDVSGKGFKGGTTIMNAVPTCNIDSFYTHTNNGRFSSRKGEGIFNTNTLLSGRGKLGNGGGGGNSTNSGGAGGGNGGSGGAGGNQWPGCTPVGLQNGGIGGTSLPYSTTFNRIFLGGGGGAGHDNDNPDLGPGGNGGGIAIISCNNLNANGHSILSNGETPSHLVPPVFDDGRSGGGAGGVILLDYTVLSGTMTVSVKGGDGDYPVSNRPGDLHGPGGGGGGGIIWVNKPVLGNAFAVNLQGGINGVNTNLSNDPWGATPGNRGDTLGSLVMPVADVLFKKNIDSVRIRKTATSCSGFDLEGLGYVNTTPVASWQWYIDGTPAASTQNTSYTFSTSGNHDVKLVVTDANGCKDSISINLNATALDFDFSYSRDVCNPMTVTFNALGSGTGSTYWNFGDGNSITGVTTTAHTYAATGNYLVKYSITNGVCTDTMRKTISVDLQQDNTLILTQDTTICYNTTKQLRTAPVLDFCWSPSTYLDNPNSPQPVTSATEDITYYFTAQVTGANLIVNGDFTQGNTGFLSAYTHTTPNTTEGQYFIGTNPRAWNGGMSACGDHTTGTGNMMMVNGAPVAGANVWSQTITVTPNTNYAFSTWVESVVNVNPAQLQFSINGKDISTLITASLPACTWVQFYTTWNSGSSTIAVISIVNKNTILAGNDFALDDISFAQVFIKRDSVKIKVEKPLVRTNNDTTVCAKSPVQLVAAGAQDYSWSPATGLTNPGIGNPVASPEDTTRYIVTGTNANGCVAKDTVYVNVFAKPAITTSDDATICKNVSTQLGVTGGVSYSWFPTASLNNPGIANPLASPVSTTTYYVTVTDIHDCDHLDSVKIAIRPDAVFAVTAGSVCKEDSLQLQASGGNIYAWSPAEGLSNPAIANPKASPGDTRDYQVSILETTCNQSTVLPARVTVLPLPRVQAVKSNDIDCSNDRAQLSAAGASRYVWTPAAGLSNSVIAIPVATPSLTTQYIVGGTDAQGCTGYDTLLVKVENTNKGAYLMPDAFTPNNDGLNDCYGIKSWGVIQELDFSIYNRWGEKIFQTKNPNQCWDGTYKGVKQNSGVFVYMIKAKTSCEGSVFRKGTFVLIR